LKIPTIPEQMLLAAAGSSITLPRKLEDILIFLSEQEDWIYAADMVVCKDISIFRIALTIKPLVNDGFIDSKEGRRGLKMYKLSKKGFDYIGEKQ
jgi:predicted transcriptional regulator